MAKKNDIIQKIKASFTVFEIIVAVATVVVGLLNVWTATKLAPLAERISVIETEVQANNAAHEHFVLQDSFNQVVTRINYISGRVDQIYSLLAKR